MSTVNKLVFTILGIVLAFSGTFLLLTQGWTLPATTALIIANQCFINLELEKIKGAQLKN